MRRRLRALSALTMIPAAAVAQITASAQITVTGVSTTSTQAILQYTAMGFQTCSLKVADMSRAMTVTSGMQADGQVTITTTASHGLLPGAVVYLEQTGVWDGWQTVAAVPGASTFTFASTIAGSSSSGNAGVLVDDVNPSLYPGGDQETRPGNIKNGTSRSFVIGHRAAADIAADGNRYSRALQANARHHYTLTCGAQTVDDEFWTQNLPVGDTHNDGPPADRMHPGQYAYPTVQWSNLHQTLIDPVTGLRSFRGDGPSGGASNPASFQTAIDATSSWTSPSGPLTNGSTTASFTGPCQSGTCPLFLRADGLGIGGGATYTTSGTATTAASLDWVQVTIANASINNSACFGDNCKLVACLTVDGVSCASGNREISLTSSPSSYTIGTTKVMDLWQDSGPPAIARPDVSQASGKVNYTAATKTVNWTNGDYFSIRWAPGSRINIAGAEYPVAAVVSERQLVLASGPSSDLTGANYSGNNFGVLLWKKTAAADQISIGYTSFKYGTSGTMGWSAGGHQSCSTAVVTVDGKPGYNCFVNRELYWMASDGSDFRDLGYVATYYVPDQGIPLGRSCASSFDPNDGDVWYCAIQPLGTPSSAWLYLIKVQYTGSHAPAPGTPIPGCPTSAPPCLTFTPLIELGPLNTLSPDPLANFSPTYAASGFSMSFMQFAGVGPGSGGSGGDAMFYAFEHVQDSKGWFFMLNLGDGTPYPSPTGVHVVGVASSYLNAPASWSTIHAVCGPDAGWTCFIANDFTVGGPTYTYTTTLTSGALTGGAGSATGLNQCPANPLNVTGQVCTTITTSGEPVLQSDGVSTLQPIQVGDVMSTGNPKELLRVLVKNSPTSLVVERGYMGGADQGGVAAHSNTTLTMVTGLHNGFGAKWGYWNYANDPFGQKMIVDSTMIDAHSYAGPSFFIDSGGFTYRMGETTCPSTVGGTQGGCYHVRLGHGASAINAPSIGVAMNPAFHGAIGKGGGVDVDNHPGVCYDTWCFDGRPLDGDSAGEMLGTSNNPFVRVAGQLWKYSGAQHMMHRKILTTVAYVGRFPLVDISGPSSTIGAGASDAYKYCYAEAANECISGSITGDVYVNAPYVSFGYCQYPGGAQQGDDTNAICIGDLGAFTGSVVQVGATKQDSAGKFTRRLGPVYSRWRMHDVFWNATGPANGALMFSLVRWFDGVRHSSLLTTLPPYPAPDSVNRTDFEPVQVQLTPPADSPVQDAVVEFGYAENGDPSSLFCTSRQETCVVGAAGSNTPFFFAQSQSYTGMSCSTGCSLSIPALPQHVLYYRWKYRDATGQVLATSSISAVIVP